MKTSEAADRLEQIRAMRAEGRTLEAIGRSFGLSKQRVQQILRRGGEKPKRKFHKNRPRSVFYKLDDWAREHDCSWMELACQCEMNPSLFYRNFVHGIGGNPGKRTIDRLLQITGLTYEELFMRELN